ncbi:MAG: methyltransferase domain-containing protein [Paludibacterium sp.]|uniref:methyltransferase domain-containing protein n=1 Tax=Paludibacterium sp. TaxID=1917523 RepID=UPI0025EB6322|nr:methyltransferase domain-containing protein [Paludibacterium sp.]MBV8047973.1 methyltransferase domain-containing protein [Paludibacterium sp.]MBV8649141.1 methyltransferase domain-containing protein [Paludibacterium sp.]
MDQQDVVRAYYGEALSGAQDLKTQACCCRDLVPAAHRVILANIEPEILARFYGCGSPIPPALAGCHALDLGCGAGRDAYLLSALVGETGSVIGVDMTAQQLVVARRHQQSQARRFGQAQSNVDFRQGYIEDLAALGIADASIDVVVSNCAINLVPDKAQVFAEIFRVLKPGGELLFADVFASRRLPPELADDPVLLGECLGGAMYIEDFRRLMALCGWPDYRVLVKCRIDIGNTDVEARVGATDFWSMTVRAFKLATLEDRCEDYGQVAVYRGSIADQPHRFVLDDHHTFITGKPMLVCGNTAAMLQETRFAEHFQIMGDRSRHFGSFDCGGSAEAAACVGGCC